MSKHSTSKRIVQEKSAGHTPGPWRTGREDMQSYYGSTGQPFSSVYATDPRAGVHLGEQLPLVIAMVNGEFLDTKEEKANARLIAAAPDLLAALRTARAYAQNELDQIDDDDAEAIAGTIADLEVIDLALAKAGAQ